MVLVSTICILFRLTFLVGVNAALEYENIDYVRNDIIIVYSLIHASTFYVYFFLYLVIS
jgi:hypothetical protein